MATGIVAVLGVSASASYTPATNAKLRVAASVGTSGFITVNGVQAFSGNASQTSGTFDVFVAGGSTVTIGTSASACSCVISALES